MDSKQLYKTLITSHPEQSSKSYLYTFLRDSYTGLGGYGSLLGIKDTSNHGWGAAQSLGANQPRNVYLDRFPLESADGFVSRIATSTYINYVAPIIDLYSDLLFRRSATRVCNSPDMQLWMQDNCLASISKRAMKVAQIYGTAFVMLDAAFTGQAKNMKEAMDQGFRGVTATVMDPTRILGWDENEDGNLNWIKYQTITMRTETPFSESKPQTTITVWTNSDWSKFVLDTDKQEAQQIARGPNPFGRVPVAVLRYANSENGEFLGDSQAYALATLNKELYNRMSELSVLLRGQSFALLVYPKDPQDSVNELPVGVGNCLFVNPESRQAPAFISPPTGNAEVYEKRLNELQNDLFRAAKLEYLRQQQTGRMQGNVSSGLSRQFSFAQCNAALVAMGKQCEKFEKDLMSIVSGFYKTDCDFSVAYPQDYEIAAGASDLLNLKEGIEAGLPNITLAKLRKNISLTLCNFNDNELKDLDRQLMENVSINMDTSKYEPKE